MIRVFWSQQGQILSVEANAIKMRKIWIAPFLFSVRQEIKQTVFLIDLQQLRHRTIARGDLVLELARVRIVKIELSPVVTFRIPDNLVRGRQVTPVDPALTRFILA